jgi:two-component system, sensor histidine kinase and response regulator
MIMRKKLISFMLWVTGAALLLFFAISLVSQLLVLRYATIDSIHSLTSFIVERSRLALASKTSDFAHEILQLLQTCQDIEKGVIYTRDGRVFATYSNPGIPGKGGAPVIIPKDGGTEFFLENGVLKLHVFHPVLLDGKRLGDLYLLLNLEKSTIRFFLSAVLLLGASVFILLLVFLFVSNRQGRMTTGQVSVLAALVRKITERGDYRIRLEKTDDGEIGGLIDDFNTMLDVIRLRDTELLEQKQHLEKMVEERTEQLLQKRDEALAAAKAKSEFLANMSHEIRTPMNGIIGVLSLLKDAPLNEEHKRLLRTATRSADSLLLIINDILDFSKIEAGKIDFESIVFDLRDLMEEVVLLFAEAASLKHLDLHCFVPNDIYSHVMGDPTRLRQILTNLLSNAIKFTEQGEVTLQVALIKKMNGQQVLRFSVEDTGIGISAEALKNLFKKFTQADGATTRKYGGTGLGLSVCKQLVELQNGEIGVDSEEGRGAIFWFILPMQVLADDFQEVPRDIAKGRRFMIVDDNATNSLIVEHYLKACQAETLLCDRAVQVLETIDRMAAAGRPVSDVLLDYHMPDTDGLQLAAEIMKKYGKDAPGLILLSSESGVREKAFEAGVRTIIYKPVRRIQLYNALSSVSRQEEELVNNAGKPECILPDLRGEILLVDDEPINQKVGMAILKKFGIEPDIANNGREAVRMVMEKRYNLVLMDIQMPEMSGFDATETIRNREREKGLSRVPIIAMTANVMESTRQRCMALGMDDFIAKPIKPDILIERLQPWLNVRIPEHSDQQKISGPSSEQKAREGGGESRAEGVLTGKIWDRKKALQFVGGDEALLRDLATLYLERNAFLQGRIQDAIRTNDAEALHGSAHAFKGAVNHFSAEKVRDLALILENKGRGGDLAGSQSLFDLMQTEAKSLEEDLAKWVASS